MTIEYIDHINIAGPEQLINDCLNFYVQVLGLTIGKRPKFNHQGYWLYAKQQPVIHLSVKDNKKASELPYLDHIAFRSSNLIKVKQHLSDNGIDFHQSQVNDLQLTQLFTTDPAGNKIELTFKGEV
ncbi:VOC family protein [Colwellia sp. MEBiC06753]